MMLKIDLSQRSFELLHFGCLYEGIINWDPRLCRIISNALANESWSGPLQHLGSGAPMSRFCRTLSQISSSRAMILKPAIDLWQQFYGFWHSAMFNLRPAIDLCQQFYRFWYLEWLCVSIILEADLNSQASIILQGDIHTLTWVHKLTWLDRLTPEPG